MFRGSLLKAWREKEGITQAEAGRRTNITQAYWYALEIGKREPSLEVLSVLSNVTGIRQSVFLGELDDVPSGPQPAPVTEEAPGQKHGRNKTTEAA